VERRDSSDNSDSVIHLPHAAEACKYGNVRLLLKNRICICICAAAAAADAFFCGRCCGRRREYLRMLRSTKVHFFRMPKNALMDLELFYEIALKRD